MNQDVTSPATTMLSLSYDSESSTKPRVSRSIWDTATKYFSGLSLSFSSRGGPVTVPVTVGTEIQFNLHVAKSDSAD